MKQVQKLLDSLIFGGLIVFATGRQNNINYESFVDLEHQGRKEFMADLRPSKIMDNYTLKEAKEVKAREKGCF